MRENSKYDYSLPSRGDKIDVIYIMNIALSPFICKLDDSSHDSLEALHAYLRRFKLSQKRYYETYFPRKDKLTGEVIEYKSFDHYFATDFNNKNNLRKWIKDNPLEGLTWSKEFLAKRKIAKSLIYAPSQTELRSLPCPSLPYFNKMVEGGYATVCRELGLVDRYANHSPVFTTLPDDASIVCDTREQLPLTLTHKTITHKLDVGDYGLAEPYDKKIYVDRKSLTDFIGTLSPKNLPRFERELQRAKDSGSYLIMMVESPINEALSFNYLPYIARHTRTTPDFIFHNLRDLLTKFPLHFQVCFCHSRAEMAQTIIKVFELGEQVKTVDLEWRIENGEIKPKEGL